MKKQSEFIRLNVNLDRLKLELSGNDVQKCLKEVNGVLDKVIHIAEDNFEFERLDEPVSDDLLLNKTVAKLMKSLSEVYDDYKSSRAAIENKKIVELGKNSVDFRVESEDIKRAVKKLLSQFEKRRVKSAIIHIKGVIPKDETSKITDIIGQELPLASMQTIHTKGDISSHTIIEGIFFGDFPEDNDDEI